RFPTHRVAAVAETAVGGEQRLAALDEFEWIGLRRHRFGRLLRGRTLLPTSAALARRSLPATAASRGWGGRLRLKECDNQDREQQSNRAARGETQTDRWGIHTLFEVYVLPSDQPTLKAPANRRSRGENGTSRAKEGGSFGISALRI